MLGFARARHAMQAVETRVAKVEIAFGAPSGRAVDAAERTRHGHGLQMAQLVVGHVRFGQAHDAQGPPGRHTAAVRALERAQHVFLLEETHRARRKV